MAASSENNVAFTVPMPRSPSKASPAKERIMAWSPERLERSADELRADIENEVSSAAQRRAARLSDVSSCAGEHFANAMDVSLATKAGRELRGRQTLSSRAALLELAASRRDGLAAERHERVRGHNTKIQQACLQVEFERSVRTEAVLEASASALEQAADRRRSLTGIRAKRAQIEVQKSLDAGQTVTALRQQNKTKLSELSQAERSDAAERKRALVAERAHTAAISFAHAKEVCEQQRAARSSAAAALFRSSSAELESAESRRAAQQSERAARVALHCAHVKDVAEKHTQLARMRAETSLALSHSQLHRASEAREKAVEESKRRLHEHNTVHLESVQTRKAMSPSKAN
eukprot:a2762_139.p1 GENE.a2762_139~~a2762_139.p1  ORF type:complete len:358 (+),score=126.20 a2762_139:29-1075(+)